MAIRLTRQQLYERVWKEPVSRISPTLGISDVGLAKACRAHGIPLPGRGHWAKKAAGKTVAQPALPKQTNSSYGEMLAFPGPSSTSTKPADAEAPHPLVAFECEPANLIVVPEELPVRHALLRSTREYWRVTARRDFNWSQTVPPHFNIPVSKKLRPRALRILQALFDALGSRGHGVERGKRGEINALVLGEKCELVLRERMRRSGDRPGDLVGAGELEMRVDRRFGKRSIWRDSDKYRLEQLLNKVMVGLLEAATAEKAFRANQERQQAEAAEAERRRIEADKRQREHDHELRRLNQLLDAVKRHDEMKALLARVTTAAGDVRKDSLLAEWLQRFRGHVDALDVLARFQSPSSSITLYFLASRFEVEAIVADGFADKEPGYGNDKELPAAVTVTDVRLRHRWGESESVVVEMPEADALPFEVLEPSQQWRQFIFPARVLNTYPRRRFSEQL
jgi:hypothetical protein